MRILGIDPGLQTTGFGVVDMDGHKLSYVASGTIRTTTLALGDAKPLVNFDGTIGDDGAGGGLIKRGSGRNKNT